MPERTLVIPVFPLPDVVLFPKIQLPLHIFEPRYREMVRHAMSHERLIGMALLKGDWEKNYYGNPETYGVGCLGEMVGVTPLPDGRYNILLYGLREYEIQEHVLDEAPYRLAKALLRDQAAELEPSFLAALKKEVLELTRGIMEEEGSALMKILIDPSIDGATWLNLCCFSLDISTVEKQSLLEAKSLEERAAHLLSVLRFRAAEKLSPLDALRGPGKRKLPH